MKKRIITGAFMLFAALSLTSCYRVTPDGDQESVLIMKPYIFGHGGVSDSPVSAGAEWCAATTDHIEFKLTPITYTEPFADLITHDNNPVDFNAYIKITIRKGSTPDLYKGFGEKWYENSIKETFRTSVRNKASSKTCFALASDRNVLDSIQYKIFTEMQEYAKKINIPVDIEQVLIGAVTPPKAILDETVHTAAEKQKVLTNNAKEAAENSRKAAETARAVADQAYQNQMKMTVDQYLQSKMIEIIKDKKEVSIILGGNAVPTLQINK